MQLFSATDFKSLLESVNHKMLFYSDASTFVRQARQVLGLSEDEATCPLKSCLSAILSVLQWYASA
jgi:hypothetical protein